MWYVLVARVVTDEDAAARWQLACGNGHRWVPVPGTELVIQFPDPEQARSGRE